MQKNNFEKDKEKNKDLEKDIFYKKIGLETEKNLALSKKVVLNLISKKLLISVMESCTGGGLVYYLTNIPGSSGVLKDSFVTYSNEAKIALGVSEKIINKYTVYSTEVATAMAETVLKKSVKADIGVGLTGFLVDLDKKNKNPKKDFESIIYLAIKFQDKSKNKSQNKIASKILKFSAEHRFETKQKIIQAALKMILDFIKI